VKAPPIPATRSGAGLLEELHAALTRYVIFPSPHAADAVTLWVAASHAQPAWEHAPRLAVVSPLKRCGKSRLLDVVAETCYGPLITVNATIAAVVRSIGQDPPTLLVDEADTLWGSKKQADSNEDLRGLLNAGHQRNRPMLRWDVTSRTLDQLDTFAMALLAAIGELPDTIMDRAVVIRMRRRAPGEHVDPYRTRRDAPPLNQLRDHLTAWARQQLGELQHATPMMPLEDRAADTWKPLVAIADLAGGDWPTRARTAAATMTAAEAQQEEDTSASVRLLADLREVFGAAEALYTTTILEALHKLEDAPWPNWYGHPLSTRDLAKLLRPYDIRSKSVREHGTGPSLKGYARADLHDAWQRYAPPTPQATHPPQDSEPPARTALRHVTEGDPLFDTSDTDRRDVADVSQGLEASATGPSWDVSHVADVADTATPSGDGWRYNQPPVPCAACGVGTTNRAPSGRPLHILCPDPELPDDPDRSAHH
jgi:Protein of unknown function (DUF3631)